jgi:hypothetical protein
MKTAMQDLKEDLQETINTSKDALLEIENEKIRSACQEVVRLTLKDIIKRIDNELLQMEKQQMKDAVLAQATKHEGLRKIFDKQFEQYYKEKFNLSQQHKP